MKRIFPLVALLVVVFMSGCKKDTNPGDTQSILIEGDFSLKTPMEFKPSNVSYTYYNWSVNNGSSITTYSILRKFQTHGTHHVRLKYGNDAFNTKTVDTTIVIRVGADKYDGSFFFSRRSSCIDSDGGISVDYAVDRADRNLDIQFVNDSTLRLDGELLSYNSTLQGDSLYLVFNSSEVSCSIYPNTSPVEYTVWDNRYDSNYTPEVNQECSEEYNHPGI